MALPQHAIILAAGNGSRMGSLTADRPKALLEVAGRTLIDRQIDALRECGIRNVTVVIGYQQQRLRDHLKGRANFIENLRYRETNSLYSLWLARALVSRGAVVLNADILVSHRLLARLMSAPVEDAVLVDQRPDLGAEEMKVKLWRGFVLEFSKALPPSEADGENVGILKFGRHAGTLLLRHLDTLVGAGHTQAWAPLAFGRLAREWPLRAVTTQGIPWIELDFPGDLERAEREIAPALVSDPRRQAA
jgi:choline kinase